MKTIEGEKNDQEENYKKDNKESRAETKTKA
jgi:hypothetical protein